MSRFDINKVQDFQRLTMGAAAGILQTLSLAGRDPSEWDLKEGSYGHPPDDPILFHVFESKRPYQAALSQIQDNLGRRKVKYKFPYVDGQTTDDLGRKPGSFSVEVLIHGNRYLEGLSALLEELDNPAPGELVHPVRGIITCVPEDVEVIHSSDKRKAAQLRITFIEHNFTIGDIRESDDKSVKGALAAALDAIAAIDNAITQVLGAVQFVQSIRNAIAAALRAYQESYLNTLTRLNQNFNTRGSNDIPALLPVNQGGTGSPSNGVNFPLVGTPIDDTTQDVVPALAANDMTKLVNETRAQLSAILDSMQALSDGQGGLDFYESILSLREGANLMQTVLETGIASSQAQVIEYTLPRNMSLREVAYINSIDVNRFSEIALLNPSLDSVNEVDRGTVLKVPIS